MKSWELIQIIFLAEILTISLDLWGKIPYIICIRIFRIQLTKFSGDIGLPEKECSKCKVVKPLDEFSKDKNYKDNHRGVCKECIKEYNKKYQPQYYEDNREKKLEYQKQYRQDNRESILGYNKQYDQDHKEERNERNRNRRANDPAFALMKNVSRQVRGMLKRNDGSKLGESVLQYLPYTIEQLWGHLRSLYTEGMTDENYGEWHLDHKCPQSLLPYDSMNHPNFLKCWALDNLQPLWASENMSKGNKV